MNQKNLQIKDKNSENYLLSFQISGEKASESVGVVSIKVVLLVFLVQYENFKNKSLIYLFRRKSTIY